jgi:ABC-2 type transport system ATP-binding protein
LLANGTASELVAQSTLSTWAATGDDLHALAQELRAMPGVDMVVPFGVALHVSGRDGARLESTLQPYLSRRPDRWRRIEPGLEDVFIDLMNSAKDNYQ